MERDEVRKLGTLIAALFAAFGKEANEATLLGYRMGLEGIALDDVARAVKAAIAKGGAFPPSAGDLRKLAPGQSGVEDRAGAAWAAVCEAIRSVGSYRTPTFADPATAPAIARIGGWVALCAMDSEKLHAFGRRDFLAEYASVATFGAEPAQLEGRHAELAPGIPLDKAPPAAAHALRRLFG